MSDGDYEELLRLRGEYPRAVAENQRLTQLVERLQHQLKESLEGNAELRQLLKTVQEKLDLLLVQTKKRNRRDFGSKTERNNPRPARTRFRSKAPAPVAPETPETVGTDGERIPWPNLDGQKVPHPVNQADIMCPTCNVETEFVSNTLTYQLEKLTNRFKRLEHEQEVRACPKCKTYIVTGEKPCPPIPGSYAGPRLLAGVIVDKLSDGLPNYRQENRLRREQVSIPRSTQCDWTLTAAFTLGPLYELLKCELLSSQIVQTDDTGIKIQDRRLKGRTRKGKMTAYRGDDSHPLIAFDFSPDQSFDRNKEFLKDFRGIVQADAANGFDALFTDGTKTEAGCNAHSRRKFYECHAIDPKTCQPILDIYGGLYAIERRIEGKPAPIRLAVRRKESKPLVKKLRKKIQALQDTQGPAQPLMKAIEYSLRHWIALTRFLKNPEINLDNNLCEQAIKGFILARKNFLFTGSDDGGRAIAVLMTFIASAKRNKIDPEEYLADVFARINSLKTSELKQLLPDRWVRPCLRE